MTSHISRRKFITPALLLPLVAAVPAGLAAAPARKPGAAILVAYFSRTGNTRVLAKQISKTQQATLFEIEPAQPYPDDYTQTVEQARNERDSGFRPALKATVPNIDSYGTIFLGFPIWGETAPPIIRAFLAAHQLAGKTIIPFITHGGFGTGKSMAVVVAHSTGARVLDKGLVLQADQEKATLERVAQWMRALAK